MASPPFRSMRLRDYCMQYDISLFDCVLKCIFCKFRLTLTELAEYEEKTLFVTWRDDTPFACCRNCLRLSAKLERERYTTCNTRCGIIESVIGKPLSAVCVRCLCCYKLLDIAEKVDLKAGNKEAFLVRGSWRAPCRNCTQAF